MRISDLLATKRARSAAAALLLMATGLVMVVAPSYPPLPAPGATAESGPLQATGPTASDVGNEIGFPFVAVPLSVYKIHFPLIAAGPAPLRSPQQTPTPAQPSPTPTPSRPTKQAATATAGPKPTPRPTKAPPKPITKVTKMGVGVYGLHAGDAELGDLLNVQPTLIVLQDPDIEFAKKVRYYFPKALIIGRTFLDSQPLDNPEQRGVELADRIAEMAVPRKGLVDAWMSYNEPISHGDLAAYEAYNAFQVAFARRLQDHYGIPAVAGNDAPGAIEPADYVRYFGEAIRVSRYFGVHAYSKPDVTTLRTPDAIYYALRYRLIHDELEAAGIKDVQMVITEAGLANGWRYKTTPEAMAADFFWMADELEKDPYVIGMAVYGIFARPGWQDFNIKYTRLPDLLGEYQPRRATEQR